MYICVDEMHMTSFVIIYSSWFPACLFGINIKTGFFLKNKLYTFSYPYNV